MRKKNLDFIQGSTKYNLPFFDDADKDKVPNILDCKPFDENRDGLFGRAVNVLSSGRFGQSKKEYDIEKARLVAQKGMANSLEGLRERNKLIEEKLKTQRLMAEQQQLRYLERLQGPSQPSATQMFFGNILGIPMAQPKGIPLGRPGYEVVYEPKLPKGFHWKKLSKKERKLENQPGRIEHRFMSQFEAKQFQQHMKQAYGYAPEIFRVADPSSGMMFFVVVEPVGLKRIR